MIEIGSGPTQKKIDCLTRLDEGQVELRLHSRKPGERRTLVLAEPSALAYARLRIRFFEANQEVDDKYPEPPRPLNVVEGESDVERAERWAEYNMTVARWIDDRANFRTDPEHAPYANALLTAVEQLGGGTIVTLDDLTPEAFSANVLQALLDVWEAPLGGEVSLPAKTVGLHEETVDLSAPPSPDSPESTPSSPPGGDPSPPSPPPS